MEINQASIEGLVDTRASMSIMATNVVRKLGIMHLMVGHETYKTTYGIVTQALRRITKFLVKVGGIICQMIFLVVDTNSYDLFLGLDILIKIVIVVNVEKGVIQVRNGPGMEVEVLPLNVVNMLQIFERSKEEKCKIREELFNIEMGQLQINNCANLLGSLDSDDFNDEFSSEEDIIKYEGKVEVDPQ
jgi:hypothetical protein